MENDSKQYRSLQEWFEFIVHDTPDAVLRAEDGTSMTYQTLNEQTSYLAGWLQTRARLGRSVRVALLMPNTIAYAMGLFATWRIGGCIVPINPDLPAADIRAQCKKSKVEAVIVASQYAHILQGLEIPCVVITKPGDFEPYGLLKNSMHRTPKDAIKLKTTLLEGSALPYVRPEIHPVEAATISHYPERVRVTHGMLMNQLMKKRNQTTLPEGYNATLQYFIQIFFKTKD